MECDLSVGTGFIVIRLFLSLVIVFSSIVNAYAITAEGRQFFFRYKTGHQATSTTPLEEGDDLASKTVNANFVGGLGLPFSEKLPLKPEWEDDRWQVEAGDLPSGISFNATTRTFEGTPEAPATGVQVTLYGYDDAGARVARAYATFDIYLLPDNSKYVDLYAHTDRFYNTTLDLPSGVVVDRWVELKAAPAGLDYNGRYVDGTPTAAGQYAILNIGYSYSGEAIFSYFGKILVEDSPTFPEIADNLKEIGGLYDYAYWDDVVLGKVVRAVKDAAKVKYSAELASGQTMPGTLRFSNDPYDLMLNGGVYDFYDQATVRLKAVDTDGATGYSNWFKVGSLGPSGLCKPISGKDSIVLNGTAGSKFLNNGYKIPTGRDSAVKEFTVTSGQLPQSLTLGKDSGVISGVPAAEEIQSDIIVRVDFPGNEAAEPITCGPYEVQIAAAKIFLNALGGKDQYRVGETLSIELQPDGGLIVPYSVTMLDGAVLPPSVSFDPASRMLTGTLPAAGSYKATFQLTNGDGVTRTRGVAFSVHNPLTIDAVPDSVSIRQYDRVDQLFAVTYNKANVIGKASLALMDGPLPEGIYFNADEQVVFGGTRLPEGSYGPFFVRLSDGSGEHVDSNPFYVNVTQRADLVAGGTVDPVKFEVNLEGTRKPFSVTQPPLAEGYLPLQYVLNGPALPNGLDFDPASGRIEGTAKTIETISGYSITINEIGPANLSKTSAPFSIVVGEPAPIGTVELSKLQGNVGLGNSGGPFVASVDPTAALSDIAKRLVGGVSAVSYLSSSPAVPGLALDTATGRLQGNPTAEYDGNVEISFTDGAGRPGTLLLPVKIHPYPALKTAQALYDVPRLAETSIKVEAANSGFYQGITWSLAPTSEALPSGLAPNSSGVITGSTSVAEGISRNIVVRGTSKANGLFAEQPLTLKVVERIAPTLAFPATPFHIWVSETTGAVVKRDSLVAANYLKGSYVKPVVWSLDPATTPSWVTINASTGVITGTPPTSRDWGIDVIGTDAEGLVVRGQATIRSTLSGYVQMSPGGESRTVRQGETFETRAQTLSNVVRPAIFVSPSLPSGFSLDQATGVMKGRIDTAKTTTWSLNVIDAHDRTLYKSEGFTAVTVAPLKLGAPTKNEAAKQYAAAQPVDIQFRAAENQIGEVGYAIDGPVPGTFYYKTVNNSTGLASFLRYDDDGVYVGPVDQAAGEALADTIARLEPDHLIFDPETLTLKGIPSKVGSFPIKIIAFDAHASDYLEPSDPTREAYNRAEYGPFTITVAAAAPLEIANSADSEQLYQYTSQPTIRTTVGNDAYGRGVTWTMLTGTLPQNVIGSKGAQVLAYRGYPENQGSFGNIVWKATDLAGREIVSDPVLFSVGSRQPLELVTSTDNPRNMIVFSQDADLTVSAKNAAYGPAIGKANWTVTGLANLPPGVSAVVEDDGVTFSGTSDVIGTYSGITVAARDPLGAAASVNLTFRVIANPEPIVLNVADIITKPNYPVTMAPPFALSTLSTDNTYGKLRFYSYDLPQIDGLSLDQDTGALTGSLATTQLFTFDLYVTDDTNRVTSKPVTVAVIPNLRLLVPTIVDGENGKTLNQTIATDYALGAVTYARGAGNWPAGIDVDPATGAIKSSGVVTAAEGDYSGLTIVGTDSFGTYADVQSSNPFTIRLVITGPHVALEDAVLPDATKRIETYSYDFRQVTTVQNMNMSDVLWSWSATTANGEKLPPGLSFTNGILSGTPTLSGTYPFTVKAYKNGSSTTVFATKQYTLVVNLPETQLELADGVLPEGVTDEAYSFDLKSLLTLKNIPEADVRWSVLSGSLPSGISLGSTTGVLSGATAVAGDYSFTIRVKYTNGTDESLTWDANFTFKVKGNSYEFTKISAGKVGHGTCGLTADGAVMCWGRLADGSNAAKPTAVIGNGVVDLSSGGSQATCVVMASGGVKCWGLNSYGTVGNGTSARQNTPVDVVGLVEPVASVHVGDRHACAILSSGSVQCWGYNASYQLGDGTKTDSWTASSVVPIGQPVKELAAGTHHTCAVTVSGGAKCWGANNFGNLGNRTTATSSVPVDVYGLTSGVAHIAVGYYYTCAVMTAGGAKCWGINSDGQLGNGNTTGSAAPVDVRNITSFAKISIGYSQTCATTTTGAAYCWGDGENGKLGYGATGDKYVPTAVADLGSGVDHISGGYTHTCALRSDKRAMCWGYNGMGQVGDGTFVTKLKPVLVQ